MVLKTVTLFVPSCPAMIDPLCMGAAESWPSVGGRPVVTILTIVAVDALAQSLLSDCCR